MNLMNQATQPSTTSIYGLTDPATGMIRYVGKSNNPRYRYQRHIGPQELRADNHKSRWIKGLLSVGNVPGLVIIDRVSKSNWQIAEKWWIAKLKACGASLTNSTSGGDGIDKGTKHTPLAVEKIRRSLIGRPVSDETRAKISATNKANNHPTPERCAKQSASWKRRWAVIGPQDRSVLVARMRSGFTPDRALKIQRAMRDKPKLPHATSIYRGVSWFKRDSCWRAWLNVNGRQSHLGYFRDERSAAIAHDEAAIRLLGPSGIVNFPVIPTSEPTPSVVIS